MNIINWIKNILTGLYLSLKRFPLTILLSASVVALLITISELNPTEDTLGRAAMVLALGIPLTLCIKLFFERISLKITYKLLITYIAAGLFLVFYYFFLLKDMQMVPVTRYAAVSLALYLGFIFIPYIAKKDGFEMYVITLLTGFFLTVIYSIVLFAGLSAIWFAIDKLLGIQITEKIYFYTWLFVVFIFAVSYFLSGIPTTNKEITPRAYPKLLRVLLLYIVMPLLTAYTIILYIYFGKIIITTTWPIGLVSHLVLWYSVIVTLVLFFAAPIFKENNWAYKFFKFAPKILLPLLIMMFISIGIRINAYGITEPRYYVVILALWVFFIMIYFSFTKKLKNVIIPVTLTFVALFSVFGPLSSYSVSKYSQSKRFEKILIKNNMLKDGSIQSAPDIPKEDKIHISSILTYFNQNHSLKDLNYIPEEFKIENIDKVFGFYYEAPSIEYTENYFNITRNPLGAALDISGYDYLFDQRYLMERQPFANNELKAIYDYESSIIKINYQGKELYEKDLNSFVTELLTKHVGKGIELTLPDDEMILLEENDKIKVKFVFQNISGIRNQNNLGIQNKGFDFYLMIKIK